MRPGQCSVFTTIKQLTLHHGGKGSRLGRTGVIMLTRGDIGGLRRALAVLQRWQMQITAPLHPRPSVRGEEPHPTRGDPVAQNTVDLKE